jgi:transcriptional regulator with XRE-family HTH domain
MAVDVQKWRERTGYSQSQLARALGVNVMTVSRWEREIQSAPPFLRLALEALEARLAKKKSPKK